MSVALCIVEHIYSHIDGFSTSPQFSFCFLSLYLSVHLYIYKLTRMRRGRELQRLDLSVDHFLFSDAFSGCQCLSQAYHPWYCCQSLFTVLLPVLLTQTKLRQNELRACLTQIFCVCVIHVMYSIENLLCCNVISHEVLLCEGRRIKRIFYIFLNTFWSTNQASFLGFNIQKINTSKRKTN